MNKKVKIVLLGGRGVSARYLYHAICNDIDVQSIILEESISRSTFIKRRIKKQGVMKVLGQLLFLIVVPPFLKKISYSRIENIKKEYGLIDQPFPKEKVLFVKSINDEHAQEAIKNTNADFIIICGTRILSKKTLTSTQTPFLNIHAGITPKYRGVHGGYWALANNDSPNCGVTLHFVDTGIDTGNVLFQSIIKPTSDDNFITYPLLQLGEGIQLLKKYLIIKERGNIRTSSTPLPSLLWYHPTIWQYIYHRLRGIK